MPGNEQEVVAQVVRALRTSSAVRALVAGRVGTAYGADADAGTSSSPSLVVSPMGGSLGYEGIRQIVTFTLESYSATSQDEALKLYDLARTALTSDILGIVEPRVDAAETARPSCHWYEGPRLWCASGRWRAIAAK